MDVCQAVRSGASTNPLELTGTVVIRSFTKAWHWMRKYSNNKHSGGNSSCYCVLAV